jgi:methionyl-tRNA synthetase
VPDFRFNEIKAFVSRGLQDFSISRLKSKMPWGIEVPGDPDHVMYVWFDALTSYIATLRWPDNEKIKTETFEKYWVNGNPTQYCGKDNLRFQSAMWQAMLIAAGLPNSHQIIINGFITGDGGVKMSKTLGNVVDPSEIVKEYGTDALRFFLAKEISNFEDTSFTLERFKDAYNAGLANGLGNLTSRILTLSEKYLDGCPEIPEKSDFAEYFSFFEKFDIKQAADYVWNEIGELDKFIQETEPFKVVKVDEKKGKELISNMVVRLYKIARMLNPILPETSILLKKLIKANKKPEAPLFLRKD